MTIFLSWDYIAHTVITTLLIQTIEEKPYGGEGKEGVVVVGNSFLGVFVSFSYQSHRTLLHVSRVRTGTACVLGRGRGWVDSGHYWSSYGDVFPLKGRRGWRFRATAPPKTGLNRLRRQWARCALLPVGRIFGLITQSELKIDAKFNFLVIGAEKVANDFL